MEENTKNEGLPDEEEELDGFDELEKDLEELEDEDGEDPHFAVLRALERTAIRNQKELRVLINTLGSATSQYKSDFPDYQILHSLAEAAIRNQDAISESINALNKATAIFETQASTLPREVSGEVKEEVSSSVKKMIEDAVKVVAGEFFEKFRKIGEQAETTCARYERVAANATWRVVLIAAAIALICSICATLVLRVLAK
jgi:hypothetical protein